MFCTRVVQSSDDSAPSAIPRKQFSTVSDQESHIDAENFCNSCVKVEHPDCEAEPERISQVLARCCMRPRTIVGYRFDGQVFLGADKELDLLRTSNRLHLRLEDVRASQLSARDQMPASPRTSRSHNHNQIIGDRTWHGLGYRHRSLFGVVRPHAS